MKAVILVIDSFGIGAMPDAERFGDAGANTASHILEAIPDAHLPTLERFGLGNCAAVLKTKLPNCGPARQPLCHYGVMAEGSPGKDTTTGHWEMAGICPVQEFATFPAAYPSFPTDLIDAFCQHFQVNILGNCAASGTEIIAALGEQHCLTGNPILYTSADSVLQIAAHEDVIGIDRLYAMCLFMRDRLDALNIARVIARPFAGDVGCYQRTKRRKDYSLVPPQATLLDTLQAAGIKTIGIGKIGDIFAQKGLSQSFEDKGNEACLQRLEEVLQQETRAFIFVNLIDTDMLYGHRRDVAGYYRALQLIDAKLEMLVQQLESDDLFIITADHGCDPTFKGSDHTREYVPLLVFQKGVLGRDLGVRTSFADVGQSIASFFGTDSVASGVNFLQ